MLVLLHTFAFTKQVAFINFMCMSKTSTQPMEDTQTETNTLNKLMQLTVKIGLSI